MNTDSNELQPLDPVALIEAELPNLLEQASYRLSSHGRELFRLRSLALRVTSWVGFAGVLLANFTREYSKGLAILELGLFSLPALFCAPGLVASTLATARGKMPERHVFWAHAHRALGIGLLGLLRFASMVLLALVAGPFALLLYMRLRFAEFVMIDEGASIWKALAVSYHLTSGTLITTLKSAINEYFDALRRYGLLRWELDSRVRRAILDVLIYDALRNPSTISKLSVAEGIALADMPIEPGETHEQVTGALPLAAPARPEHPCCPRCGNKLVAYQQGDICLLRCDHRHGVWADNSASLRIVATKLPDAVVREIIELDGARAERDPRDPIRCPICALPLVTHWVPAGQVYVDTCSHDGTWFDVGELERLIRGYEKAARDREEIAELLKQPHKSPYSRGLAGMAGEFDNAAEAFAPVPVATVDYALEGREEDRTNMWLAVAFTAANIVFGDKDAKDAG